MVSADGKGLTARDKVVDLKLALKSFQCWAYQTDLTDLTDLTDQTDLTIHTDC